MQFKLISTNHTARATENVLLFLLAAVFLCLNKLIFFTVRRLTGCAGVLVYSPK